MATYSDMEELIRLGAYRTGSSAEVDEAITLHKPLEAFLAQSKEEVNDYGGRRTSGWSEFSGAKKHKTNVIGAQSAGMVQNVGTRPRREPSRSLRIRDFGEYLVDEVT